MKTLILTASLVATILAGALSAQAAEKKVAFDGYKFFEDNSNRGH